MYSFVKEVVVVDGEGVVEGANDLITRYKFTSEPPTASQPNCFKSQEHKLTRSQLNLFPFAGQLVFIYACGTDSNGSWRCNRFLSGHDFMTVYDMWRSAYLKIPLEFPKHKR